MEKTDQPTESFKSTYEAFSMQDRVRSDILDRQRDLIDEIGRAHV